ncbi:hypothetical protein ACFW04_007837 [Cataglyphis niger]
MQMYWMKSSLNLWQYLYFVYLAWLSSSCLSIFYLQ